MNRPIKLFEDMNGNFYIKNKKGEKLYIATELSKKSFQKKIIKIYKKNKKAIKLKNRKRRAYRDKPITRMELGTSSQSYHHYQPNTNESKITSKDSIYITDIEKEEMLLNKIKKIREKYITTAESGEITKLKMEIENLTKRSNIGEKVLKSLLSDNIILEQKLNDGNTVDIREKTSGRPVKPPPPNSGYKDNQIWRNKTSTERTLIRSKFNTVEESSEPKEPKNATYDMLKEQQKNRKSKESKESKGEERLRKKLEDELDDDIENEYMLSEPETNPFEDEEKPFLKGGGHIKSEGEFMFCPIISKEEIHNIKLNENGLPTFFIVQINKKNIAIYIDKYNIMYYDCSSNIVNEEIKREVIKLIGDFHLMRKFKYSKTNEPLSFDTGFCAIRFINKILEGMSFKHATNFNEETDMSYEEEFV